MARDVQLQEPRKEATSDEDAVENLDPLISSASFPEVTADEDEDTKSVNQALQKDADWIDATRELSDPINTSLFEDLASDLVDFSPNLEDKEIDLEDNEINHEDKKVALEDKEIDLKDKKIDLKDKAIDLEDKEIEDTKLVYQALQKDADWIEATRELSDPNNTSLFEDLASDLVDFSPNLEDKEIDLEDKEINHEDKEVDLEDKEIDLKDKNIDLKDKAIDLEEKEIEDIKSVNQALQQDADWIDATRELSDPVNTSLFEDLASDLIDFSPNLEDKEIDLEDKEINHEDKEVDLEDKEIDLKDKNIDLKDKAIDLEEKEIEDIKSVNQALQQDADWIDATRELSDPINTSLFEDLASDLIDFSPNLEDKEINHEDKKIDLKDKAIDLEEKDIDLEDKEVDLEDKEVNLEHKEIDLGDKEFELKDKEFVLEDKKIDLEDEDIDLVDKEIDLDDKEIDLEEEEIDPGMQIDPGEGTSYGQYSKFTDYDVDIFNPDIKEESANRKNLPSVTDPETHNASLSTDKKAEDSSTGSGTAAESPNVVLLYECYTCRELFRTIKELTTHARSHQSDKQHECGKCSRSFTVRRSLVRHWRSVHNKKKPFTCDNCGQTFARRYNITQHFVRNVCGIRIPHQTRKKKGKEESKFAFECKNLEKLMEMRKSLMAPMGTRSQDQMKIDSEEMLKHTCDKCQKRFKTIYILNRHKKSHSDEKPFACDECEKKYKHKQDLVRHKKNHTR